MKNILIVALLIFSFQVTAQVRLERGKYGYKKAIRIAASKTEIYSQAHEWIEHTFEEDKYDIHYADHDEGMIVVKGTWYHETSKELNEINFTFKLEAMDGIYRESIEALSYAQGTSELPFENKKLSNKRKVVEDTEAIIDHLSASLIAFMHPANIASVTASVNDQMK